MTYRVIQWATGNVGRAAIEAVAAHPELELVGCRVYDPDKSGLDAGTIAGIDPQGVEATDDVEAVLGLDADCVIYSPMLADDRDVTAVLRSGKNVVTPVGWIYPDAASRANVEGAARAGGVTLHGTGIHPGGITERFPITLSALCSDIRHVRAEEFSDIRTYDTAFVVRDIMLFGHPPEQAATSPMVEILGSGFTQSIRMLGDALGLDLDEEVPTDHEWAVATQDLETPVGMIEAGTIAAQRFTWTGTSGGSPVITVRVNWLMGEEHLEPAWTFGPEGERFEVAFEATPPLEVTFHGLHPPSGTTDPAHTARNAGIRATANHCVNAVPAVCEAPPGVATYLDLPAYGGRFGA